MNTITVIGSINLDRTLRVKAMPKPGETIHAIEHFSAGGGKGANQAVAAQRAGASTYFIGAVGRDGAGDMMKDLMGQEGIDLKGVTTLETQATGQAFITVDQQGENSIIIYAGANNDFTPEHVRAHEATIKSSDFVIAQFESAMDSTIEAFKIAREANVKTILNPAPALENVPQELLELTDIIVPNETETEIITGIKVTDEATLKEATAKLHDLGIETVIITLGSKGAYYDFADQNGTVPAFSVRAIDTTAAGDTFIGAFASVLKPDFSNIEEAILHGNKASSITVQRYGAQPSIPYQNEIESV
ncbi:ribokinase [Atopobacter phocae]|uniref:ribokinase n=1 Tax=Atopobacter phocae TaxID=136492 RepID=UPI0004ACED75|nr:ribokinase [Atopobacter phocae]